MILGLLFLALALAFPHAYLRDDAGLMRRGDDPFGNVELQYHPQEYTTKDGQKVQGFGDFTASGRVNGPVTQE